LKHQKAGYRAAQAGRGKTGNEEEEEAGDREQDDLPREAAKGWQCEDCGTV
jgi:hypothetical protein